MSCLACQLHEDIHGVLAHLVSSRPASSLKRRSEPLASRHTRQHARTAVLSPDGFREYTASMSARQPAICCCILQSWQNLLSQGLFAERLHVAPHTPSSLHRVSQPRCLGVRPWDTSIHNAAHPTCSRQKLLHSAKSAWPACAGEPACHLQAIRQARPIWKMDNSPDRPDGSEKQP